MGYTELISALRAEGEENVRAIWQKTEEETKRIREEASKRIESLREGFNKRYSLAIAMHRDSLVLEAYNRTRDIRLRSEKELSDRLYTVAVRSLYLLRDENYDNIFNLLVKELPLLKWMVIRVNPLDDITAKKYFPDAEVIPDSSISGGLDVTEESGGIRIINTFEKRLERAWMYILPELIISIKETF